MHMHMNVSPLTVPCLYANPKNFHAHADEVAQLTLTYPMVDVLEQ